MERPVRLVCLIYVLSFVSKDVQAGQGRIHLRGSRYNEPEDVVAFESECKCNRDEVISISVESSRLPGVDPSLMEDLDLFFDYTMSNCNGSINYSQIDTTFNFQINENCGVYIAESALTVPPYRAYQFEGYLMQARLDFYYEGHHGNTEYLTADVNCACEATLEDNEKDPCIVDNELQLRFVKEEIINCRALIGNDRWDMTTGQCTFNDNLVTDEERDCFQVIEQKDDIVRMLFNFTLDNENCVHLSNLIEIEEPSVNADQKKPLISSVDRNSYIMIGLRAFVKYEIQITDFLVPVPFVWKDTLTCTKLPKWTDYSGESKCQAPCGAGKKYRRRICENGVVGAPGCEGDAVLEINCIAEKAVCDEPCPTNTTHFENGQTCLCSSNYLNRVSVLLPVYLIDSNVELLPEDVYIFGSQQAVIVDLVLGGVNGDQVNFYYHTNDGGVFLSSYSPVIAESEVENVIAARSSSTIRLISLTLSTGYGGNQRIDLVRVFPVYRNYSLPSGATQVFMGSEIVRNELNGVEFNYAAKIYGSTIIDGDVNEFLITSETSVVMWCSALVDMDSMPSSSSPPELEASNDNCVLWKPFDPIPVDYPENVNCDCDKECDVCQTEEIGGISDAEQECPESCKDNSSCDEIGSFPCERKIGPTLVNVTFESYNCESCFISQVTCDANGHFSTERVNDEEFALDTFFNAEEREFCRLKLSECPACDETDIPFDWTQWSECSSYCSKGTQTRSRNFLELPLPCDPAELPDHDERECIGNGRANATKADKDEFNFSQIEGLESKQYEYCENAYCKDEQLWRNYFVVNETCYYEEEQRSCDHCCEISKPSPDEQLWNEKPCPTNGVCHSGRKSITVESDCPNVDYSEDFSQPCLIDLDNDGCPCNSDVDFTDPPCVHIEELREQGPCRFIEHISDWKALAYNCLMEQGGTCDGMVDCVPDSCTPEKRENCCEPIDPKPLDTSDNCLQVVKKCYDKTGEEIAIPCADCTIDTCVPENCPEENPDCGIIIIGECDWSNKTMEKMCKDQMGGSLYCDTRLPECQGKQKRFCRTKEFGECHYEIKCDCDVYKCTQDSITIKGVDQEFFERLRPQTNDLHKIYGEELNFFIGSGSKEAYRTEGCFHHYKSEEIDLVYDFGHIENKCGVNIDGDRLNTTIWVDSADRTSDIYATATPFANVACHIEHVVNQPPPKNITSLMRFKPLEFIKIRKYEHDLSFEISTDPNFHELLQHRHLQNLVLVGDKMYARIRSLDNDSSLKIKVVKCTVKKVNNQDLSLDFIEDGCKNDEIEEFDFLFNEDGRFENGMGPEVRFEWVNFVWRGFTNVEGDQSTVGREEQQYSCDVEVCSPFDECKPVCIDAGTSKKVRRNAPVLNQSNPEGVDFDLEVFRTEAALKQRYQEILANHVENGDEIDLMMSRLILALSVGITLAIGFLGIFTGYRYIKKRRKNVLTARIFRRYQRDDPPKYSVNPLKPAGKSLLDLRVTEESFLPTLDYETKEVRCNSNATEFGQNTNSV